MSDVANKRMRKEQQSQFTLLYGRNQHDIVKQ